MSDRLPLAIDPPTWVSVKSVSGNAEVTMTCEISHFSHDVGDGDAHSVVHPSDIRDAAHSALDACIAAVEFGSAGVV